MARKSAVKEDPKQQERVVSFRAPDIVRGSLKEIVGRREPGADGLLFGGYSSASYGRAIARVCKRHKIPHWTPHQIRHARGTDTLRVHGVAAARALLGHKSLAMVSRYAAVNVDDAKKAVSEDG